MPLKLIKGYYRILGSAPDGDSVHFHPADPTAFTRVHLQVHLNHAGGAQLRLDGIDSLETHYQPRVGQLSAHHQPFMFGHGAANELLAFLEFTGINRGRDETVTQANPAQEQGYILTRSNDKYGRCVAFAFKGTRPDADLSDVHLDLKLLQHSVNYHMLVSGLAYPTYYTKLYWDIRGDMTAAVVAARAAKKGLWAKDATTKGFSVNALSTLTDSAVIMPKLYRRLVDYLAINGGSISLVKFHAYLASRNDRLFILSNGQATGFDLVLDVQGQKVTMTHPPEDLVFVEA